MHKNILVTGATGMIGSKLTKKLSNLGYTVGSVSRNIVTSKSELPWCNFHVDYKSNDELIKAISESFAVINLAGAPIATKRWTDEYKKTIMDSRIHTTRLIVEAINNSDSKPSVLINGSAIGYYGNTFDKEINEKSDNGTGFLADVTVKWEKEASRLNSSVRLVLARIGIVLDRNGGALAKMALPFKLYAGGRIGSGKQWMSWIHIDDIIDMFLWALQGNIAGPVNFVAPNPVNMKDFAKSLGKALNRPSLIPVPEFAIKLILGEAAAMVTNSNRIVPELATQNGYNYKYISLQSALFDIYRN